MKGVKAAMFVRSAAPVPARTFVSYLYPLAPAAALIA